MQAQVAVQHRCRLGDGQLHLGALGDLHEPHGVRAPVVRQPPAAPRPVLLLQLALPGVAQFVPVRSVVRSVADALRDHLATSKPAWLAARRAELAAEETERVLRAEAAEIAEIDGRRRRPSAPKADKPPRVRKPRPPRPPKLKLEAAADAPVLPVRKKSEKDAERARKRRKRWKQPAEMAGEAAARGSLLTLWCERPETHQTQGYLEIDFGHWLLVDGGAYEAATLDAKRRIAAGEVEPKGGWDAWIHTEGTRRWAEASKAESLAAVLAREQRVAAEIAAKAAEKRARGNQEGEDDAPPMVDVSSAAVRPQPKKKKPTTEG